MNKNFVFLFVFIGFLGLAGNTSAAVLTLTNPLCPSGVDATGNPIDPNNCVKDLPGLIKKVTDYIFTIIGALAVLMFVWAGILFVTSSGNEGRVKTAKNTLIFATIGAAIALSAAGLSAVIKQVIGAPP